MATAGRTPAEGVGVAFGLAVLVGNTIGMGTLRTPGAIGLFAFIERNVLSEEEVLARVRKGANYLCSMM
jgi:hypothetical protein